MLIKADSLYSKILKTKYFPSQPFIEIVDKKNSSYTWKSILAGRDVLILGLRWYIGDGTNIKIWGNWWILGADFFWPASGPRILDSEATINTLLDPMTGDLNMELIRRVFNEEDVRLIS